MSRSIFRQVALERLSTPEQLDQALRVTTPTGWLAIAVVAGLVLAAVAWSLISTAPVKVSAQGILISPGGILEVVPASEGRVVKFLVQPGDPVAVGQEVAVLEQPDLQRELETASAELAEMSDQLARVREFNARDARLQSDLVAQKRESYRQSIDFLEDRLRWLREREGFEGELLRKQVIGRQRAIDTKIEISQTLDEIARTRNAIKQVELEETSGRVAREREMLNLDMQVNKLQRHVESLSGRLERRTRVISPYAGHIVELKTNPGEIVGPNTALFSLLPEDERGAAVSGDLVAVLYVAPADGKKVQPGMDVQIAPSTVKREEYGFILGRVRRVAEVPSSEEGMMRSLKNRKLVQELAGRGAPFEVVVELLRDPGDARRFRWSASRGPNLTIDSGTLCEGSITVRSIHVISLVIPALEPMFDPGLTPATAAR